MIENTVALATEKLGYEFDHAYTVYEVESVETSDFTATAASPVPGTSA